MPGEQEERWRCAECGTKLTKAQQRCHDPAHLQARLDTVSARVQELEGELADVRDDLDDAEAEARAAASQWGRTREESQKKINAAESHLARLLQKLS